MYHQTDGRTDRRIRRVVQAGAAVRAEKQEYAEHRVDHAALRGEGRQGRGWSQQQEEGEEH
jgi:hypothetical protein